jgi:hypothetical protein
MKRTKAPLKRKVRRNHEEQAVVSSMIRHFCSVVDLDTLDEDEKREFLIQQRKVSFLRTCFQTKKKKKKNMLCEHAMPCVNFGFLVVLFYFPWRDILASFTFVWVCYAGRHHGFGRRG